MSCCQILQCAALLVWIDEVPASSEMLWRVRWRSPRGKRHLLPTGVTVGAWRPGGSEAW